MLVVCAGREGGEREARSRKPDASLHTQEKGLTAYGPDSAWESYYT